MNEIFYKSYEVQEIITSSAGLIFSLQHKLNSMLVYTDNLPGQQKRSNFQISQIIHLTAVKTCRVVLVEIKYNKCY